MSTVLLTIPQVSLRTSSVSETGQLAVELLSTGEGPDAKLALVFHLGPHSVKLDPGSLVKLILSANGQRTYVLASAGGVQGHTEKSDSTVRLVVPPPSEDAPHLAQDIETFDHLLTQYTDLSWAFETPPRTPPPLPARPVTPSVQPPHDHQSNIRDNVEHAKPVADPDLRGHLVLMDESTGDIVGELPNQLNIHEDSTIPSNASASDPVVLEMQPALYDAYTGAGPVGAIGNDLLEARDVIARAVPAEEQDWLMKGATLISQAISGSTSLFVTGVTSASNYYIAHTKPGSPKTPDASVPPSPSTSSTALAKAHALSGSARAATQKTSDMLGDMIVRAVGGNRKSATPSPAGSAPASAGGTPPNVSPQLQGPPPAYVVYTPRRRPQQPRVQSVQAAPESEKADEAEPEPPRGPPGIKDKLLMSANLIITTVDDSARRMFEVSTDRIGAVVGHKYGSEAQRTTHLASHTARNVVLVYVDMRGFARRALLKRTGKEFIKARVSGTKSVAPTPPPEPAVQSQT
ncbi:Senescence domain-containing protein [Phanerochaete sordida]|uniref:Senescence domain-containing protein n=1 Tax=Phanerochaete sordida TaxID=48140 RepID=A0A9P3G2S8_9APHY|nr:Senescence domain-containing protein [Phanerochaete sordida]